MLVFHSSLYTRGALLSVFFSAPSAPIEKRELVSQYEALALQANTTLLANLKARGGPTCNFNNVAIRRAFGALSQQKKRAYTDTVQCLVSKPNRTPLKSHQVTGSDLMTLSLPISFRLCKSTTRANFLHGTDISFESTTLREECCYDRYQPYWDWPLYAAAPQDSPIFTSDEHGLSGNGVFSPHNRTLISLTVNGIHLPDVQLQSGLGGGCVISGPFQNLTQNLAEDLSYDPTCLTRDIGPYTQSTFCNYSIVNDVLTNNTNIADSKLHLQSDPAAANIGCHGSGHYGVAGDEANLFTSSCDPIFYLHHAQIDRMWTIWQALDPPGARYEEVAGTLTFLNAPPSDNVTLDTPIDFGYVGAPVVRIGDVVSSIGGPFCYLYA